MAHPLSKRHHPLDAITRRAKRMSDITAKYLKKYNNLFSVTGVDRYRDGGTIKIETTTGEDFYIDHRTGSNTGKIFDDFSDKGVCIEEPILREYLIDRLKAFAKTTRIKADSYDIMAKKMEKMLE